jgi:osmoprotectant transport system ATP-binding protein
MIEIRNLCKSYDGGRTWAVQDLSLDVPDGQLLALVGSSGSGKTTSLKMINRLIEPTSGSVRIDGHDTQDVDPVQLRRSIGYAFQMIGLFPHMTVAQNVGIVLKLLKQRKAQIQQRVDELLDMVSLPPAQYRGRMPEQLSGGQSQRVGFARALAAGPQIMLLDEPFGALDPLTRAGLRQEFGRLQRRLHLTTVLVTHDMTEALLLADRIAVMDLGRLLRVGAPQELMADPKHSYVAALLETPRREAEKVQSIAAGGGAP